MMFKDIITLVSFTEARNELGDIVKTPIRRENIFADKKSVRQSEFYQAAAVGFKPEIVFVIRNAEYNGESTLEHNNRTYSIIRTYEKESEFIELICEGGVNRATS